MPSITRVIAASRVSRGPLRVILAHAPEKEDRAVFDDTLSVGFEVAGRVVCLPTLRTLGGVDVGCLVYEISPLVATKAFRRGWGTFPRIVFLASETKPLLVLFRKK